MGVLHPFVEEKEEKNDNNNSAPANNGNIYTERGPDIVRMPSMGQKRTISGMRTISEGHKIPMVVILFITP